MSVHPRSIYAALFEYERANGGRQWPYNAATLADIIAEVHAVAKKHNRSREIQLRMKRAVSTDLGRSDLAEEGGGR